VRPRLIVIGPLPPPYHGVAVSTSLVLKNALLQSEFEIQHLDTTDSRPIGTLGKWDTTNMRLALRSVHRLFKGLRGTSGVVYLPLSENTGGFFRDSLFITVAAARGWKTAVHIRNSMFRDFYGSRSAIFRAWIRFTLRRVTAFAVLGESIRPVFRGLVPDELLTVVPNGTPDIALTSSPPNPRRVLYLSNLLRKKGVDRALEAALLVLEKQPDAEFIFAGDWEDQMLEEQLRARATRWNGQITFLPAVSGREKQELLASAWVLVFPVVWGEGHPRVVLEALAAGVPVVSTNRATIAETVGDGEAGFILPNPDPTELATRILLLLADPALRARMSRAARHRYLAHFTQEQADRRLADWLTAVAIQTHLTVER
jgi:glycosyltransferase involved in cell wall biosynthesis